jgi:predicted TIM-barrel fold metal-dependent hydrolase
VTRDRAPAGTGEHRGATPREAEVVDCHLHVNRPSYLPAGYRLAMAQRAAHRGFPPRDVAELLPRVGAGYSDPDGAATVAELDRIGVAAAVVPMVDWGLVATPPPEATIAQQIADYARVQRRYPDRLRVLVGIDPRRRDAAARLRAAHATGAYCGLKLYPPAGFGLDDDRCRPLYDACREVGWPVVVHTGPVGPPMDARFGRPAEVAFIQRSYPELDLVLAHAGGIAWWREAVEVAAGSHRTYVDMSQWWRPDRYEPEVLPRFLRYAVGRLGAHRVLYGSDLSVGPAVRPESSALERWLRRCQTALAADPPAGAGVDPAGRRLVLGGNARRLFFGGGVG